ncbi:TonB-dependent receptor domain-containing protein [Gluconacetobacter asukensis]|nr:TonB-dependent receptor [Gluconacetobacter asukensis]
MDDHQIKQTTARSLRRKNVLLLAFTAMSGMMYSSAFAQSAETATPASTPHKPHVRTTKAPKATRVVKPTTAPVAAAPAATLPVATAPAVNASILANAASAASTQDSSPATENVIVTGTLFRDPNLASASPITEVTRQDMAARGLKNVTDALQVLSANGAGNLTNSFSANGAFAAGASAPSLRGMSTDSTLVLMDGQRLSYYPLADDGERNFVDTNWMPSSIMDRVDVMQDGGSATYGADAVAGVVNYITRKQIKGFEGNAEGGLSQRGDTGHQKLYATYGWGDLNKDGWNLYINSEYQQDDALFNRQLGYPYNTGDLSGLPGGFNGNSNVVSGGTIGNFAATPGAIVSPVTLTQTPSGGSYPTNTGPWQLVNPAGCAGVGPQVSGAVSGAPGTSTACTQNTVGDYKQIQPEIRRINATMHFTANVTPRSQFTTMFNYSQTLSTFNNFSGPYTTIGSTPYLTATAQDTYLPASSPYNPTGQTAQILASYGSMIPQTSEFSQNFRGSMRYAGWAPSKWGSDWNYDINFVGMNTMLQQVDTGFPTVAGIENSITSGAYNFANPSANSQAELNSIAPRNVLNARSQEYSEDMHVSKGLFKLPGGMVNVAVGGNIRWESVNDPNANPANASNPASEYVGINPFSAKGSRWVESGYFEVALPIVKMLNVDVSGRYDNYSTGMHHFSPKVGVNFKPVKQFLLRGTFSRGFRVPSFAETNGSVLGYTGWTPNNAAFAAAHNNDAYSTNATSIGLNTVGNPNLRPEISTNFTGGAVISPLDWLHISADYYYIKKTNYIMSNPSANPVLAADNFLSGAPLPAGILAATPGIPDIQAPNAPPLPGYFTVQYVNARSFMTNGVDLSIDATRHLPGPLHDVLWFSKGTATYVHASNLTLPDGSVYHYAGTIGPYEAVSASGTPRWKASWANTLSWKGLSVTPTVYYTSGYKTTAEDQNGPNTNSCAYTLSGYGAVGAPGTQCHVKNWWDVDLTVNYQINQRWSVYANVYNLLGFRSPYDFSTYGSYLYNSSWTQKGVVMRSFQFGVNVRL